MPELPEVETTRRGLLPHVLGQRVAGVTVRDGRLRWQVPKALSRQLGGATIEQIGRRAKYLLFGTDRGCLIVHLGMSGALRVLEDPCPARAHDHVDVMLANGKVMRYTDPRRFGAILWKRGDPLAHPLLADLGPEPWAEAFSGAYLYETSRGRRAPVKAMLMDGRVVAGVGNIYATEALFAAGLRPDRAAGRISLVRYERLVAAVREVLARSIEAGGTTLRDFTGAEGNPGYFRQTLNAYGREGEPCRRCGRRLRMARIAQRTTVYCVRCQR